MTQKSRESPRKSTGGQQKRDVRLAFTDEAQENQMISLAMDLARERILDGTASSQLLTHFLRLGTTEAKLKLETMRTEQRLMEAKINSFETTEKMQEMLSEALRAFSDYRGGDDVEDSDL